MIKGREKKKKKIGIQVVSREASWRVEE